MKTRSILEVLLTALIAVFLVFYVAYQSQYNLIKELEHGFVAHSENLVVLKNHALELPFHHADEARELLEEATHATEQLAALNQAAINIENDFPRFIWTGDSILPEAHNYYVEVELFLRYLTEYANNHLINPQSTTLADESTLHALVSEDVHYASAVNHEHLMSMLFTTNTAMVRSLALSFAAFALIIFLHLYEHIIALQHSQKKIKESLTKAEQASHAKSLFLSSMSHELRTPMNGVLGIAELLRSEQDIVNEHGDSLDVLVDSSKHLLTLLDDILDYSNMEQDKYQIIASQFHIRSLLAPIESVFRLECEEKGLGFSVNNTIDAQLTFKGDIIKIRKVLFHLLGNAVKFTERGKVSLDIDYHQPTQSFEFTVTDSGIGIDAESQAKIFNAFEQSDQGLDRAYDGAGLGLTIVKKISELMNGNISIDSKPGFGSTFRVTLQVSAVESREDAPQRAIALEH